MMLYLLFLSLPLPLPLPSLSLFLALPLPLSAYWTRLYNKICLNALADWAGLWVATHRGEEDSVCVATTTATVAFYASISLPSQPYVYVCIYVRSPALLHFGQVQLVSVTTLVVVVATCVRIDIACH